MSSVADDCGVMLAWTIKGFTFLSRNFLKMIMVSAVLKLASEGFSKSAIT
jgi:hypothetical protein